MHDMVILVYEFFPSLDEGTIYRKAMDNPYIFYDMLGGLFKNNKKNMSSCNLSFANCNQIN
jgi:hypothetical protein